MPVAIFDLDDTLLAGDSDRAWGEFLAGRGMLAPGLAEEAHESYVEGTIDFDAYTRMVLAPMRGKTRAEVDALLREYIRDHALGLITQAGRQLVEKHRRLGHRLVIATATNELIAAPIAQRYRVDHLVATEAEWRDDALTGDFCGVTAFREGKLAHLLRYMDREQLPQSYFYSDSHNDLPLLQAVGFPHAVNPDRRLLSHARERGWPVMELRDAA